MRTRFLVILGAVVAGCALAFLVRPAQFFFSPFAVADIADRTQHQNSVRGRYWAKADFDGEF